MEMKWALPEGVKRRFPNNWSGPDRNLLLGMLQLFDDIMGTKAIPYTMGFGSVLGLARHGGMIPWAECADVLVKMPHATRLHEALPTMKAHGLLYAPFWGGHNMWLQGGYTVPNGCTYKWPVLNVLYYHDYTGHSRYMVPGTTWKWPFEVMYPFQRREFEGLELPFPADPGKMCDINYGEDWRTVCRTNSWSHRRNERGPVPPEIVPVSVLEKAYQFVEAAE